jgi:hypothetical protein
LVARHHKEAVGFCIRFALRDSQGNVVAMTTSPPILITDDHKSAGRKLKAHDSTRPPQPYDILYVKARASPWPALTHQFLVSGRRRGSADSEDSVGARLSQPPTPLAAYNSLPPGM